MPAQVGTNWERTPSSCVWFRAFRPIYVWTKGLRSKWPLTFSKHPKKNTECGTKETPEPPYTDVIVNSNTKKRPSSILQTPWVVRVAQRHVISFLIKRLTLLGSIISVITWWIKSEATEQVLQLQVLTGYIVDGWPTKQTCDPQVVHFKQIKDQLSIADGILYKGEQVIISKSQRSEVKHKLHAAHLGYDNMVRRVSSTCFLAMDSSRSETNGRTIRNMPETQAS